MTETAETEHALADFVQTLPEGLRLHARSLAHAWESGGGTLVVGKMTTRLVAGATEKRFTAATIRAKRRGDDAPALEWSRVVLEQHGADWTHWSDEFADLADRGFDATARFPCLRLDETVHAAEVARLVTGLRDLAAAVTQ